MLAEVPPSTQLSFITKNNAVWPHSLAEPTVSSSSLCPTLLPLSHKYRWLHKFCSRVPSIGAMIPSMMLPESVPCLLLIMPNLVSSSNQWAFAEMCKLGPQTHDRSSWQYFLLYCYGCCRAYANQELASVKENAWWWWQSEKIHATANFLPNPTMQVPHLWDGILSTLLWFSHRYTSVPSGFLGSPQLSWNK